MMSIVPGSRQDLQKHSKRHEQNLLDKGNLLSASKFARHFVRASKTEIVEGRGRRRRSLTVRTLFEKTIFVVFQLRGRQVLRLAVNNFGVPLLCQQCICEQCECGEAGSLGKLSTRMVPLIERWYTNSTLPWALAPPLSGHVAVMMESLWASKPTNRTV